MVLVEGSPPYLNPGALNVNLMSIFCKDFQELANEEIFLRSSRSSTSANF